MKGLVFVLVVALGIGAFFYFGGGKGWFTSEDNGGVKLGQNVEQVEKVLGEPTSVIPNFGNELRTYKGKSGHKYLLIFKNGELVEIKS